jgi:hypothetical protein
MARQRDGGKPGRLGNPTPLAYDIGPRIDKRKGQGHNEKEQNTKIFLRVE